MSGFSQLFSEQISERLFVYPEDECIERPSLSASEEIFIFLQRNIWRPWKYCVLSSLLESMIQFNHEAVDEWEKLVNNWNSIMRSNFVCRPVKYIEKGGKSYLLLKRGEKEGKLSFAQDIWFATDNGCKSFTILANCKQAPAFLQDVHVHCSSTSSVSLHPPWNPSSSS